jgi:hypothetical protein
MVFIVNKYTQIYNTLIERAKSRTLFKDLYTEKHHIIPRSLGGDNSPNNIAILTAKEHYICHLLLIRITEGPNRTKMRYAAFKFASCNPYQKQRHKVTARQYQYLKEQLAIANKERPGPNLGKRLSQEQKDKISSSLKGKNTTPKTDEHRKAISLAKTGQKQSQATKDKRAHSLTGGKRSTETKAKMSNWQKGVPKPKVICKHCGKEVDLLNHNRWHGSNCKQRL